ncbi:uncharacterized protein AMSG_07789 [Thecamonas trahens ATCC 50062]|uniref:DUF7630 domain-containing protein n=1 Tax=Thecamonas trahens ATCC 50062 TaxID=461836 RepID=A0A0L0DH86_THETB|nr:hypothetical protein AMSG_07789 [Thecamonas trahens ATCC 50062]KNC51719.1 hypothetical protein AMSG_07789 [Thecamonas trahens ATCC 50062]|eukprot:XP_013755848.1 hypothetical protein AMSG_07789 [Thecamonas trahens ATCC 50062]
MRPVSVAPSLLVLFGIWLWLCFRLVSTTSPCAKVAYAPLQTSVAGSGMAALFDLPRLLPFARLASGLPAVIDLTAGDIDNDGVVDLVYAHAPASVSWLRGLATAGSFASSPTLVTSSATGVKLIGVGDVTGDGTSDIIYVSSMSGPFVAAGLGAAAFDSAYALQFSSRSFVQLQIADVRGNSSLDIITTDASGSITVFALDLRSFSGGVKPFIALDTNLVSSAVVATAFADMTNSGELDVVAAFDSAPGIVLCRNVFLKTCTVLAATGIDNYAFEPRHIALGDVNGDSHVDIVAISGSPPQAMWHPNGGSGAIKNALPLTPQSPSLSSIVIAAPAVIYALDGSTVRLFSFDATNYNPFVTPPHTAALPSAAPVRSLKLGRTTGSGDRFISAVSSAGWASIIRSPDGALQTQSVSKENLMIASRVVTSGSQGTEFLLCATGSLVASGFLVPNLGVSPNSLVRISPSIRASAVAVFDLTGDTLDDFVAIDELSGDLVLYIHVSTYLYDRHVLVANTLSPAAFQLGAIGSASDAGLAVVLFADPALVGPTLPLASRYMVAVVDVNSDGLGDVVVMPADVAGPILFYDGGAGGVPLATIPDLAASGLAVSDVDGDGAVDVVVAVAAASKLVWFPGLAGSGPLPVFGLQRNISLAIALAPATKLIVDDLTADGFLDIVVSTPTGLSLFEATPAITAAPVVSRTSSKLLASVAELGFALQGSQCWSSSVLLEPGAVIRGCPPSPIVVPSGSVWAIEGTPTAPAVINCTGSVTALFDVQGHLILRNVRITGGLASSSIPSLLGVSGSGVLELDNVRIDGFSSVSATFPFDLGTGSAISVGDAGRLEATNCSFVNNVALRSGGAVAVAGASATAIFADCILEGNTALGLGKQFGGGAVAVIGNAASVQLTSCELANNHAPNGVGGALFMASSALSAFITLTSTEVRDATAGLAGGCIGVAVEVGATSFAQASVADGSWVHSCWAPVGGCFAVSDFEGMPSEPVGAISDFPTPVPRAVDFYGVSMYISGYYDDVARIGNCTADYGGAAYVCNAQLFTQLSPAYTQPPTLVAEPPLSASIAGSGVFICGSSTAFPVDTWFSNQTPDRISPAVVIPRDSYGGTFASRAASLQISGNLPGTAASGVVLGATAPIITIRDAYGTIVTDASLRIEVTTSPELTVRGAESGLALLPAKRGAPLTPLAMLLPDSTTSADGMDVTVTLSPAGIPELAIEFTIRITGCPRGSGVVSRDATGIVCGACDTPQATGTALFSLEPCAVLPDCPSGTFRKTLSNTTGLVACRCLPDFYVSGNTSDVCSACPSGAVCFGDESAPLAAPGFFPIGDGASFASCLRPKACSGAGQCADGYEGFMCNDCAAGHYTADDRSCRKCPSDAVGSALLAAVAAAAVGVAPKRSEHEPSASASEDEQNHGSTDDAAAASDEAPDEAAMRARQTPPSLSMIIVAFQVIGILADANLAWGSASTSVMGTFNMFNVNLSMIASECTVGSYALQYVLAVCLPLLVIAVAIAALAVAKMTGLVEALREVSLRGVADTVLFPVAPLLYIPVARATLLLFACTRLPTGDYVVIANPGLKCGGETWLMVAPVGAAAILIFVLGIPIYFLLTVAGQSANLFERATFARYGALYKLYRKPYFWGEVASLTKRLSLVVATVFLADVQLAQIALLLGVLIVSLCLVIRFQPFYFPIYNSLELRLTAVLLFILVMGVFSYSDRRADGSAGSADRVIFVCVVLGLVALVVVAVIGFATDMMQIRAERSGAYSATTERLAHVAEWLEKEAVDLDPAAAEALTTAADAAESATTGAVTDVAMHDL